MNFDFLFKKYKNRPTHYKNRPTHYHIFYYTTRKDEYALDSIQNLHQTCTIALGDCAAHVSFARPVQSTSAVHCRWGGNKPSAWFTIGPDQCAAEFSLTSGRQLHRFSILVVCLLFDCYEV